MTEQSNSIQNSEYTSDIFCKTSLDNLKGRLISWLDWNMTISEEKEFHIKEEGKKLILKVTETGGRDYENDGTEYYMVMESLKDENEMNEEIEKDFDLDNTLPSFKTQKQEKTSNG
jgi:hypothetical protein|tara:strand:- start:190 stop:537 length:348 start_codon:yes stop_codon:yes gene_type:complete